MGASYTEQVGVGKTLAEAHRNAVADAQAYYGHQDGYSGAINSGDGTASLVALPARMTFAKLQALLEDAERTDLSYYRDDVRYAEQDVAAKRRGAKGRLAQAKRTLAKAEKDEQRFYARVEKAGFSRHAFDRLFETYRDKWGGYLAVELRGAEKTRYASHRNVRRGEKVFLFFGYAPS